MKREINPSDTSRATAFEMWMSSQQPMVTVFKTIDITRIVKLSHKTGFKFNMLMCYCIGKAANRIPEFLVLPENDKLMKYDKIGINVIVPKAQGGINWCDIPFDDDINEFKQNYLKLTKRASEEGEYINDFDLMIIGTSNLSEFEFDGVVNQYNNSWNNPFMAWGKYRSHWFRKYLKLSFQFHHVQMDGEQACRFLQYLQEEVDRIKI